MASLSQSLWTSFVVTVESFVITKDYGEQEAKATAAFKAQIEKLQQERDEFQRMVIGNQVKTLLALKVDFDIFYFFSFNLGNLSTPFLISSWIAGKLKFMTARWALI